MLFLRQKTKRGSRMIKIQIRTNISSIGKPAPKMNSEKTTSIIDAFKSFIWNLKPLPNPLMLLKYQNGLKH